MIYRRDIDVLKGFAILAVVLYHIGVCSSGYLGVDAFLVISGFLVVPSVITNVGNGSFRYFQFLERRAFRLLPLVLMASVLSMIFGYVYMLPDDFENLSESVVASSFFSNNILESITTRNYWDVGNAYKPLMHLWYVGILFEFYLLMPLIVMAVKRLSRKYERDVLTILTLLTILSLVLYIIPTETGGGKFYYLHYRFYELCLGGIVGTYMKRGPIKQLPTSVSPFILLSLLFLIFFGTFSIVSTHGEYDIASGVIIEADNFIPPPILLLSVVALTSIFLIANNDETSCYKILYKLGILGVLGKMSYSLFVWHQPLLAFYRYTLSDNMSLTFIVFFLVIILLISYLSYLVVEKKIKPKVISRACLVLAFLIVNVSALYVYSRAGVLRDIPELNISTSNVHANIFAEYCDRVFKYDKEFSSQDDKIKVLILGNSFSRDWANILLESEMADKIELSYSSIDNSFFKPDAPFPRMTNAMSL